MSKAVDRTSSDRLIGRLTNGERTPLKRALVMCVIIAAWLALAAPAIAQAFEREYEFRIEEETLGSALDAIVQQTELVILYPYELAEQAGVNSVIGQYTVREALEVMLRDTQFSGGLTEGGVMFVSLSDDPKNRDREGTVNSGKVKKGLLASVSAFMFGAGTNGAALAQDEVGANDASERDTIIVTAQKREQSLQEVPISVVAITGEVIAERGINNFEDLGLAVPGLAVQDAGPGLRRIYIRGIGNASGFASPIVGVYLDEVSVGSNPAFNLDLRPYDLKRVEVLKGPQGTLYGDGSVGGTIRFITNNPELDAFRAKADVEAAFTKNGAPSQKVQGVLNVPLVEDKLALRVTGTFDHSGGWIDQPAASQEDFNDQNVTNVRAKLLWQPTERLEAIATALVHRNDGSVNNPEDEAGNYTQTQGALTTPSATDDYDLFSLTVNYDFGFASLVSATGYLDAQKNVMQTGVRLPFAPPPAAPTEILTLEQPIDTEILNQEIRLVSNGGSPWNWSIGGYYNDRSVDQSGTSLVLVPALGPPAFPSSFVDNQTSESWAIFADTSIALTEWLEVGGGLRYFEDDRTFSDGVSTQEGKFDALSPRAYVSVDLTEKISTFASVAKGFRSGGFNPLGQPAFQPEDVLTYELGSKFSLWSGRLDGELSLFYSEYQDFQTLGLDEVALAFITSNSGDAEIKGIDWSFNLLATENLSFEFSGNYVDTEVVRESSSRLAVGDPLEFIPDYSFSGSATYEFEWINTPGFIRIDYNQQAKSSYRDRGTGTHFFSESDVINMLNLNLSLQVLDNLSLGVFGRNLLDDRGFIDPLSIIEGASRSRPRTIGVRMGMDF